MLFKNVLKNAKTVFMVGGRSSSSKSSAWINICGQVKLVDLNGFSRNQQFFRSVHTGTMQHSSTNECVTYKVKLMLAMIGRVRVSSTQQFEIKLDDWNVRLLSFSAVSTTTANSDWVNAFKLWKLSERVCLEGIGVRERERGVCCACIVVELDTSLCS